MEEIRIIFNDNTRKKYIANSTYFDEDLLEIDLENEKVYVNLMEIKLISIRKVD